MDEAIEYLLVYLEDKYEEEFVFVGDEHEDQIKQTGTMHYFAYFTPKDAPDKRFLGRLSSDVYPSPKDDYGKYLFKEEAEAICGDICKEKDYIESYTVELNGIPTNATWTEKHTVEDYMGEGTNMDAFNYVTVYLKDGLTDEEYAVQVSDLMGDLVVAPCALNIEVQANGERIYWNNIYRDYKPDVGYDRALGAIKNQKIDNERSAEHTRRLEDAKE